MKFKYKVGIHIGSTTITVYKNSVKKVSEIVGPDAKPKLFKEWIEDDPMVERGLNKKYPLENADTFRAHLIEEIHHHFFGLEVYFPEKKEFRQAFAGASR